MRIQEKVRAFHEKFNLPRRSTPALFSIPPSERDLRVRLLREEFEEYLDAEERDRTYDLADALADMVYVIFGTAVTYGLDLEAVLAEVHRSNMSKTAPEDGGKVIKGPDFFPPDIEGVLLDQIGMLHEIRP